MGVIDIQQLINIILYLALVIYGIIKFKALSIQAKLIVWFCFFLLVSELVSLLLAYYNNNNIIIFHLIPYLHHFLLSLIYYHYADSMKQKLFIKLNYLFFFLVALTNTSFFQDINQLPFVTIFIQCVLIVVLAFNQNANILNRDHLPPINLNSSFWFNAGNLTFYSFIIIIWLAIHLFLSENDMFPPEMYFFMFLLNIVLSFCYFKAVQTDFSQRTFYKKYGY